MKLSILIPTLPSRFKFLEELLCVLLPQVEGKPVEVLWLGDNKQKSVGQKRNDLLSLAVGEYLAFVDDDDMVSLDYIDSILEKIPDGSDVICFEQIVTIDGNNPKRCIYGLDYEYTETKDLWTGKPAHTMAWKTSVATSALFPGTNYGEDTAWVSRVCQRAKTESRIDKPLYFYRFNRKTTETRGKKKNPC